MSQARESMIKVLNDIVVPRLREQGFKGSFPHFRRPRKEKIDLLSFQFDKWGGGFVIEISACSIDGVTTYLGHHIPPNKVTTRDMHPNQRYRLQPKQGGSRSDWFRYDDPIRQENVFEKIAYQILPFLLEAEKWWKD